MAPGPGRRWGATTTAAVMNAIEKQTLADGFRVLLVASHLAPDRGRICWRSLLFDGGRRVRTAHGLLPRWACEDTAAEGVRGLLRGDEGGCPVRVAAVCGSGCGELLRALGAAAEEPAVPGLDLKVAACRLMGLAPGASDAALARVFRITETVSDDPLSLAFAEDLLWALVAVANQRGLGWEGLVALGRSEAESVSFAAYDFCEATLLALPEQPGVYVMRDSAGAVLYVGKAASLARRLRDYFRASAVIPEKLATIRREVRSLEYRLVGSEIEALLVENHLIAELCPRINVQRSVNPGSSRYRTPDQPVALVAASVLARHVDLFLFGGRAQALQLHVRPARLPVARLRRTCRFVTGQGRRLPTGPAVRAWGEAGDEICSRYWARFRNRLTWLFLSRHAEASVAGLVAAVQAVGDRLDPAEFRLEAEW